MVATTPDEDLTLWQHGFEVQKKDTSSNLRDKIMQKLKIEHLRDKPFWELSGGQIKRIGLAALLINYDKYWILDEPIAGLDNNLIGIFMSILEERKALGKGCLIISHKADFFQKIIDNNYLIESRKFKNFSKRNF